MVAEGLVSGVGDDASLLGGRRRADGKVVFPLPRDAGAEAYDAIELPREGTLWSYTVQRFRPKPPYAGPGDDRTFTPYAVGYVELPDAIIVETRIQTDAIDRLRIGMPMTFTLQSFRTDADGAEVLTYAFRPSNAGDAQ
jgi:hypothetical protein